MYIVCVLAGGEWKGEIVCVPDSVCVCGGGWQREKVCEKEWFSVRDCVRESEGVCVWERGWGVKTERERERVCVCVCVCVCIGMSTHQGKPTDFTISPAMEGPENRIEVLLLVFPSISSQRKDCKRLALLNVGLTQDNRKTKTEDNRTALTEVSKSNTKRFPKLSWRKQPPLPPPPTPPHSSPPPPTPIPLYIQSLLTFKLGSWFNRSYQRREGHGLPSANKHNMITT